MSIKKNSVVKKPAAKISRKSISPKVKEYLHYHKDGSLWAKGSLRDGVMVGDWEWFRKDGSLMRIGHFNDQGEQVGEWVTYAADGSVVKVTQMKSSRK